MKFFLFFSIVTLSCSFPAIRFFFIHALWLNIFYILLIAISLFTLAKRHVTTMVSGWVLASVMLVLISLILSTAFSPFTIRAGRELLSMLAGISILIVIKNYYKENFVGLSRFACACFFAIFLISTLAFVANDYPYKFEYNIIDIIKKTLLTPSRFLTIFKKTPTQYPFEYSNLAGLFSVMLLPFICSMVLTEKNRLYKFFWLMTLLLCVVNVFAAKSMATYGTMCIVLAIGGVILALSKLKKSLIKSVILLSITMIIVVVFVIYNRDVNCLYKMVTKSTIKNLFGCRYYLAMNGIELFKDRPVIGYGMNISQLFYLKTLPSYFFPSWQFHFAPVQYLVNFGILGVITLCIVCFTSLRMLINVLKNGTGLAKTIAISCVLSLLSFSVFLTEFSFDVFGIFTALLLIFAVLTSVNDNYISESRYNFFVTTSKLFYIVLCALTIYCSLINLIGKYYFYIAVKDRATLTKIQNNIQKALNIDSKNYHYLNQLGSLFASKRDVNARCRIKAIELFEKSLNINKYQSYPNENLGTLYAELGLFDDSYKHCLQAIKFAPTTTYAYITAINMLIKENNELLAKEFFKIAKCANCRILSQLPKEIIESSKYVVDCNIITQNLDGYELKTYTFGTNEKIQTLNTQLQLDKYVGNIDQIRKDVEIFEEKISTRYAKK